MTTYTPVTNKLIIQSNVPEAFTKMISWNQNNVERSFTMLSTAYNISSTTMNYRFNFYYNPEYTVKDFEFISISGKKPQGTISDNTGSVPPYVQFPNTQWVKDDGWVLVVNFETGEEEPEPPTEPEEPTPLEIATEAVVTAEASKTQADKDAAQVLVSALEDSHEKTALQVRIDAIKVPVVYNNTLYATCNIPLAVQEARTVDDRGNILAFEMDNPRQMTKNREYAIRVNIYPDYEIVSASLVSLRGYPLNDVVIDSEKIQVTTGGHFTNLGDDWVMDITVRERIPTPEEPHFSPTFNKLYQMTLGSLDSLASDKRQSLEASEVDSYIINVLELPFDIPSVIVGDVANIVLGEETMETTAPRIITDIVTIDLGAIDVPDKYNNSLSYKDVEVKLYMPFNNPINLDAHYVIGQRIRIEYIVDLYYGNVNVNVYSSKTNRVIFTDVLKVGRSVPFVKQVENKNVVGNVTNGLGIMNGSYNCYIEVIQPVFTLEPKEVVKFGELTGITGNVSVDNFMFESDALPNEKDEILRQLKSGVFIR